MRAVPRSHQNNGKRNPPDQVVGYVNPSESPRQLAAVGRDAEPYRAEYFAKQPNQHDWPVPHGSVCGAYVSDTINANNHSEALPYEDWGRRSQSDKREE